MIYSMTDRFKLYSKIHHRKPHSDIVPAASVVAFIQSANAAISDDQRAQIFQSLSSHHSTPHSVGVRSVGVGHPPVAANVAANNSVAAAPVGKDGLKNNSIHQMKEQVLGQLGKGGQHKKGQQHGTNGNEQGQNPGQDAGQQHRYGSVGSALQSTNQHAQAAVQQYVGTLMVVAGAVGGSNRSASNPNSSAKSVASEDVVTGNVSTAASEQGVSQRTVSQREGAQGVGGGQHGGHQKQQGTGGYQGGGQQPAADLS